MGIESTITFEMKRISLALLLVATSLAAFATQSCRAQVFYSVISPEGGQNWLLGTIHSEDPRVLDFPPVLDQALKQAGIIGLELVPDRQMLERLAEAMRLPDGQKLSDRLDEPLYERVRSALAEYGMDADSVDRLQPWAAAMTLGQPPVRTGRFMDLVLARRAAGHGAVSVALETVDEQLEFFTGLGEEAHVSLLRQAVEDRERRLGDLDALLGAYLESDLQQLERQARDQLSQLPPSVQQAFRVQGITLRNIEMAHRAQPLLDRGAALIAVGALHLPGEKGLVALLREQGNRVEAIY